MAKNIEIKAKSDNHELIQKILHDQKANFIGLDHQIDHYYNVPEGRLKLRLGNIEKSLIFYKRENSFNAKESTYQLFKTVNLEEIHPLLISALDLLVTVDKHREIYYIQNAKIHLDVVDRIGRFLEVEIVDDLPHDPRFKSLHEQCLYYQKLFMVEESDLIDNSYSDMILELDN
jgi:predicted adenylyl cyclase CyaB